MTDDDFGKTSGKLIENVAIGAAGIAGAVIAGPGGGVAAGAVAMTALEWLRASANANDGRVFEARFSALEDQVTRLDEEVRKVKAELAAEGKQADRQDFLSQEAVYSDFARAVADAHTPEKREALVNAAAHQFDPRLGSPEVRQYWFDVVRSLADVEIWALRLCSKYTEGLAFAYDRPFNCEVSPAAELALTAEETGALQPTVRKLIEGGLVQKRVAAVRLSITPDSANGTDVCVLSKAGDLALKFIAD